MQITKKAPLNLIDVAIVCALRRQKKGNWVKGEVRGKWDIGGTVLSDGAASFFGYCKKVSKVGKTIDCEGQNLKSDGGRTLVGFIRW